MKRFLLPLLIVSIFFISSCNNTEIGNAKDVNPESIYFDYKIWGEEGQDNITVKLQYRFAGENGTSLLLEEPAKVELDGELLRADSSKMTGVYYEAQKPVASFTGKHIIIFTASDKKHYKEVFDFQPVSLESQIPATLQKDKHVFKLMGLDAQDHVRVLLTDTSFSGEGINRLDTVFNGRLSIEKEELQTLANGPVQLEFTKEDERPVKNGTREGGRILISYTVRREFMLKD